MAAKLDGAIIHWINADYSIGNVVLSDAQRRGNTFEHEARIKHIPENAFNDVEVVLFSRAGNDWERGAVARLEAKAAQYLAEKEGT